MTTDKVCATCNKLRMPKDETYNKNYKCMRGVSNGITAVTIDGDYTEHAIIWASSINKWGCTLHEQ